MIPDLVVQAFDITTRPDPRGSLPLPRPKQQDPEAMQCVAYSRSSEPIRPRSGSHRLRNHAVLPIPLPAMRAIKHVRLRIIHVPTSVLKPERTVPS